MNWLFVIVLMVLIVSMARGYKKGFLRILYSLLAVVATIIFVTITTPYISDFIEKHTTIQAALQEKCLEHIRAAAEKNMEGEAQENREKLNDAGVSLPDGIWEDLIDAGIGVTDNALEQAGLYEMLAENMAHFIVNGIAYFVALIVISTALFLIARVVNLVARLPLIRNVNHFLGVLAGGVQGMIFIWIFFYLITVCCTSPFGMMMISYVNQSRFLMWLYHNNPVLYLAMAYF